MLMGRDSIETVLEIEGSMGYNPDFIKGCSVSLPVPSERIKASAYAGGKYIDHTKHSLLFNRERGFAICVAHNIDAQTMGEEQLTERKFRPDPKIQPVSLQILNDQGYRHNCWDRGHLARRKSVSWGSDKIEIEKAEQESDYYSNIVPQHERLHDDAWGKIEDWMLEKVQGNAKRACVFTGPVLTREDPVYQAKGEDPIQIPAGFWKIIVVPSVPDIKSASFLVWQRDYNSPEPLVFSPILEQVRLTTIEVLTGLSFHNLARRDTILFAVPKKGAKHPASMARREKSGILENVVLPDISHTPRSMAITSPDDIVF